MLCLSANAQSKKLEKQAAAIEEEADKIYQSEMASWYGSDLFDEKFKDKNDIKGGYVSYSEGDVSKCIFISKGEKPKAIATFSFDPTYNVKTAVIDGSERALTALESDLVDLRLKASTIIQNDTIFKFYKNISFNVVPIINGKEKKVYVLSGPKVGGVVVFGNDYLITFDKNNNLVSTKRLHKNINPTEYKNSVSAVHTHLKETGDFITATDICTLRLYEKYTQWESYMVMSKDYVSIWDCKKDKLLILTMEAWQKISDDVKDKKD
jgi:hypothetical protein